MLYKECDKFRSVRFEAPDRYHPRLFSRHIVIYKQAVRVFEVHLLVDVDAVDVVGDVVLDVVDVVVDVVGDVVLDVVDVVVDVVGDVVLDVDDVVVDVVLEVDDVVDDVVVVSTVH